VDGTLAAYNSTTDAIEWVSAGAGNVADNSAEAVTGVWEIQDDTEFNFGDGADWSIEYDESVDNQLLIHTAQATAAADTDPMFEILVDTGNANGSGMDADQQVFGVSKGTQASNVALLTLDEDGDLVAAGTIGSAASNAPALTLDETDGTDWQIRVDDTGNSLEIGSSQGGVGDNVELEIDEDGDIHVTGDVYVSGGNINTGNIAIVIGDATTDTITLLTDGTGEGEVELPNDVIGDEEIDWTDVTGADITLTDAGAITGTTITAGRAGTDGSLVIYSEQGATDYSVSFAPHATMTGDTAYVLPLADGSAGYVLHTDASGNLSWDADDGSTPRWDQILDATVDGSVGFAGTEQVISTSLDEASHVALKIDHTDADVTAATTLFQIDSVDDDDADLTYMKIVNDSGSGANTVFSIGASGATVIGGSAEGTDALTLTAGDITLTDGDLTLTAGDAIFGEDVGITGALSITGTTTWGGTAILETGAALQFGDATDATVTHTYGNTGTNVEIAYSTAAMAVTGSLTATNLSGTNTGDNTVATDFDAAADTDMGDYDMKSIDGLYGVDGDVYLDLGTQGKAILASDTTVEILVSDEDITFADGGANLINVGTNTAVATVDFGTINLATDALDLSSGSITNLAVGGLPDGTIDNGCMADDAIGVADLATDAVTMDAIDADGDFASLTGDWTTTGFVSAQANVQTDAAGAIAITVNAVNYGTDSGDADIPDGACNAAADVGNWVVLISSAADQYSLTSNDASNIFILDDLTALTAGDELDVDGSMVCVMCIAAEYWKVTGYIDTAPTDGGVAD